MDHFGAGVSLLQIVREGNGNKNLPTGIVSDQDTTGIFPSNGRTCLYLSPGNLGVYTRTQTPLGDKVVDAPLAVFIPGNTSFAPWST